MRQLWGCLLHAAPAGLSLLGPPQFLQPLALLGRHRSRLCHNCVFFLLGARCVALVFQSWVAIKITVLSWWQDINTPCPVLPTWDPSKGSTCVLPTWGPHHEASFIADLMHLARWLRDSLPLSVSARCRATRLACVCGGDCCCGCSARAAGLLSWPASAARRLLAAPECWFFLGGMQACCMCWSLAKILPGICQAQLHCAAGTSA